MQVWRICAERHRIGAFSGAGSLRFSGRWHAKGTPVVYTATSLSLAAIELFVNLETLIEPEALVSFEANVPDELCSDEILASDLEPEWWTEKHPSCLAAGMEWLTSRRSLALFVPSAALIGERNLLLNPSHPEFLRVAVGSPKPFRFDPRMFRRA